MYHIIQCIGRATHKVQVTAVAIKCFFFFFFQSPPIHTKLAECDRLKKKMSSKMSKELASIINDGLYQYEQELWGERNENSPEVDTTVGHSLL